MPATHARRYCDGKPSEARALRGRFVRYRGPVEIGRPGDFAEDGGQQWRLVLSSAIGSVCVFHHFSIFFIFLGW